MRIGIDGERGFSFGVDENWKPHPAPEEPADSSIHHGNTNRGRESARQTTTHKTAQKSAHEAAQAKRVAFYKDQDWNRLLKLLVDAGMLEERSANRSADDAIFEHLQERLKRASSSANLNADVVGRDGSVHGSIPTKKDEYVVCVDRVVAMIALTAFHDVMKIEVLLRSPRSACILTLACTQWID